MDATKYNLRNPAVKRIMQEMREIQRETSGEIMAEALEDNIFEWHFAIKGPPDTEFEGGIYQGRIILPPEYPFKPPSFIMITPSGRFETGVKICLSMSSHHPEHWQPSWSVRVALVALIAFLPTSGRGAIGSLDFTKDERRALAQQSRRAPPTFGSDAKQSIINDLHMRMLAADKGKQPQAIVTAEQTTPAPTDAQASRPSNQPVFASQGSIEPFTDINNAVAESKADNSSSSSSSSNSMRQPIALSETCEAQPQQAEAAQQASAIQSDVQDAIPILRRRAVLQGANDQRPCNTAHTSEQASEPASTVRQESRAQTDWEDLGLTVLAVFLSVVIVVILLRKLLLPSSTAPDLSMDVDVTSFD